MKMHLTYLIVALLVANLTACGFKLRGEQPLPAGINQVWVQSQLLDSPLYRALNNRLKEYQISRYTGDTPPSATVGIYLQSDNLERRLLSLFSTGQVAEYELIYQVNYQVSFPQQEPLNISFSVSQEYQDDPDEVLAKSRELELVLSEMRDRAADRIIRLLPSQANSQ